MLDIRLEAVNSSIFSEDLGNTRTGMPSSAVTQESTISAPIVALSEGFSTKIAFINWTSPYLSCSVPAENVGGITYRNLTIFLNRIFIVSPVKGLFPLFIT
jgi:hypothetical protein